MHKPVCGVTYDIFYDIFIAYNNVGFHYKLFFVMINFRYLLQHSNTKTNNIASQTEAHLLMSSNQCSIINVAYIISFRFRPHFPAYEPTIRPTTLFIRRHLQFSTYLGKTPIAWAVLSGSTLEQSKGFMYCSRPKGMVGRVVIMTHGSGMRF